MDRPKFCGDRHLIGRPVRRLLLSQRYRLREMVVWLVLLVGVLNFLPFLWSPLRLAEQPLELRLLKDLPLVVMFVTALFTEGGTSRLRPLKATLLVWVCIFGLLLLIVPTGGFGLLASTRYYLVYPFAALAVGRLGLTDVESRRVHVLFAALGVAEAMLAIAEFAGLIGTTYYEDTVFLGAEKYQRAIGTLGQPNNLALFLAMAGMLFVTPRRALPLFSRPVALFGLSATLVGIAAASSRGTVLAFGVAVVLISALGKKLRALLVLGLAAGLVVFAAQARNIDLVAGTRVTTIPAAWETWLEEGKSFFVGHGLGSFHTVEKGVIQSTRVDSFPLLLAGEGGILALVGFGTVLVAAVRILRQRRDSIGSAMFAATLPFLLLMPIYNTFRFFPAALLFWVFVGLSSHAASDTSTSTVVAVLPPPADLHVDQHSSNPRPT